LPRRRSPSARLERSPRQACARELSRCKSTLQSRVKSGAQAQLALEGRSEGAALLGQRTLATKTMPGVKIHGTSRRTDTLHPFLHPNAAATTKSEGCCVPVMVRGDGRWSHWRREEGGAVKPGSRSFFSEKMCGGRKIRGVIAQPDAVPLSRPLPPTGRHPRVDTRARARTQPHLSICQPARVPSRQVPRCPVMML
jgi:hypothetical protein